MAHIHELIDFIVNAFIVYKDKVLLIKHKELGIWLPIGGHIELNEDPEEALCREIKEECGLNVSLVAKTTEYNGTDSKFLPLPAFLDIHSINEKHRHIAFEYVAIAKNDNATLNAAEHHEIKWFSEEELDRMELKENVKFLAKEALKIARNL